ncbi:hypothetical protein [Anaerocolumna sp.]|uniref:hypothetical protein n=1 Tax=Anaerocolumna sp. TaxID=2041569 RepID=UPI0028A6752D|nr:hypothetical protein [Anaerocolumna sp.]
MSFKLLEYQMPCGWQVSFSSNWIHKEEEDGGENIFYTPDSNLTIRITSFHAEKQGILAPIEVMENAFMRTIPKSANPKEIIQYTLDGFYSKAFEDIYTENGTLVYRTCICYYAAGELLSINVFSTSKEEGENSLSFLKTLRKTTC